MQLVTIFLALSLSPALRALQTGIGFANFAADRVYLFQEETNEVVLKQCKGIVATEQGCTESVPALRIKKTLFAKYFAEAGMFPVSEEGLKLAEKQLEIAKKIGTAEEIEKIESEAARIRTALDLLKSLSSPFVLKNKADASFASFILPFEKAFTFKKGTCAGQGETVAVYASAKYIAYRTKLTGCILDSLGCMQGGLECRVAGVLCDQGTTGNTFFLLRNRNENWGDIDICRAREIAWQTGPYETVPQEND